MTTVRIVAICVALLVMAQGLPDVQAQSPSSAPPQSDGDRLPVRRVVLYKGGVGYFEHLGRVTGDQQVTITFTSDQLDDVLKSVTVLDLDGGRISGVNYNSDAGLARRLGALRLPLGERATRAEVLGALRGARVEVRGGASRVTGRLLSVERRDLRADGAITSTDSLSVITDAGEIHSIALAPGISVRILDADLGDEVGKYLSIVSSQRDQDARRLTISTAGTGERDLFVSYVSEVPVWKTTYRLVLGDEAANPTMAPLLQGWAIVDNTIGEDWNGVELSLVAGAPQAFIQKISQPYYVARPVVPLPERALLAPQTHASSLTNAGPGAITGQVTDTSGGSLPGVTISVRQVGRVIATVRSDGSGQYRVSGIPAGVYDLVMSLDGFLAASLTGIRVSAGSEAVADGTLQVGAMSEELTVSAAMPAPAPPPPSNSVGLARRSTTTIDNLVEASRASLEAGASAADLGDLFEYRLTEPVTIRQNQSALVPILSTSVQTEKVSIWNPAAGARPRRAVWLTNSTNLTLDGGSVTIIEGQAFAGEGLVDTVKAGERRLLSYAVDLGMTVASSSQSQPTRVMRVQMSRGLLIQQREEYQATTYTARNEDTLARELVVEHPVRAGWVLGGDLTPVESTAAWHRFRVTVAPKSTATFTVRETHPLQTRVSISSLTDDQVQVLITTASLDVQTSEALREVVRQKAEIGRLRTQLTARQAEVITIGRDQERVRENMKALKGSADERQLVQRYVRQLNEQEDRLEVLRREIETLSTERDTAQAELNRFIEGLST